MGGSREGDRQRLSDGTIVVPEHDEAGQIVRETYYTPDGAWVRAIVEHGISADRETTRAEHLVEALISSGSSSALRRRLRGA
jgi:hypothetical protein